MKAMTTVTTHSVYTVAGVIGGTLFSIFANLNAQSLVETIVLAVIGTVVSFAVSLALAWIRRKLRS
jgi:hypothetical protein